MKSIFSTMKTKLSPAALLAVLTIAGSIIGSIAYAGTRDLDHQHSHGFRRCSSCGCGQFQKSTADYNVCKCGHSYYDHYN